MPVIQSISNLRRREGFTTSVGKYSGRKHPHELMVIFVMGILRQKDKLDHLQARGEERRGLTYVKL